MNKSKTTLASTKGMSTLARPKFAPGMLLQHDDLEQLNFYTRDLSRLMFRSLFGCGVMCGLVVTWDIDCGNLKITVAPGVALSCSGDPIEVPNATSVVVDRNCHPEMGDSIWVKLCGTVKCCAPRTSICESDDDETKSECTRERDGYEIVAESAWPDCACGCKEPLKDQGDPVSNDTRIAVGTKGGETKAGRLTTGETTTVIDCKCADPKNECYKDHYAGICGCHCENCSDCECKCIVLARLDFNATANKWTVDHSVRRFIRPVLMRDPRVEIEEEERKGGTEEKPTKPQPPAPTPQQPPPTEEPKAADEPEESKAAAEFEAAKPAGKVTKPKKPESS
jgi:hypothetical protein